jgi:hypothetical protein
MFKPQCSRIPHSALKCEISASRRPRRISAAGIILIDRQRSISVFEGGVLEASPARAGFLGYASVRAGDQYPISGARYDRLLFGCCARLTPHDASRGNSVHERRAARGPRTKAAQQRTQCRSRAIIGRVLFLRKKKTYYTSEESYV